MKRLPLLLALLLLFSALPLSAASRFWTGAVSANWSDPGNWGGTAPVSGDTLYFPAAGANKSTVNDFPAGFRVNGFVAENGYTLAGNAIDLGADMILGSTTVVTLPIRLVTGTLLSPSGGTITVNSPIDLNGHTLTVLTSGRVVLNGIISGAGGITKNHDSGNLSDLVLAGNNTYTGFTLVNGGRLVVPNANGLGAGANNPLTRTVIYNGGSLVVQNALIGEALEIGGPGFQNEGALQTTGSTIFNGSLTLTEQTRAKIEGTLGIHGRVTGPGGLTLDGAGVLTLYSNGNDFAGPLNWLSSSSSTGIVAGVDNALPTTLELVTPAAATLTLNGHVQRLRSIAGLGTISLSTDGELLLTNAQGVWGGQLTGTGNFFVNGGAMSIVDANSVTGQFQNNGASITLTGNGTFSTATRYTQTAGTTVSGGGVHMFGPVTLTSGTYSEAIGGTAPSAYGKLQVTGTLTLGGASLALSQTALVPAGALVILENDGTDPVSGTFTGLPEGATVPGGLQAFTISYAGGTGNDVVLLAAVANTSTSLTSTPNPSSAGQSVTLTATVTSPSPGTPTGTVTFRDGATVLGTAALTNGTATFSTSALTAGSHSITATYNGDTSFSTSTSPAVTQVVAAAVNPEAIPALDARGLAVLAAILGIMAVVALRR